MNGGLPQIAYRFAATSLVMDMPDLPDFAVFGHWLLGQKCLPAQAQAIASKGDIVVPDFVLDTKAMRVNWCVLLAIGPEVGKPRTYTQAHRAALQITNVAYVNEYKIGDFMLLPDQHPAIKHIGENRRYVMVDEQVPMLIVRPTNA